MSKVIKVIWWCFVFIWSLSSVVASYCHCMEKKTLHKFSFCVPLKEKNRLESASIKTELSFWTNYSFKGFIVNGSHSCTLPHEYHTFSYFVCRASHDLALVELVMLACQRCFLMWFCSCLFVSMHTCLFLWKQRPSQSVSHKMLNVYYCVCLTEIWISNKQRQRRWKPPGNTLHPQHTPAQHKKREKTTERVCFSQDKQIRIRKKKKKTIIGFSATARL